MSEMEIQSDMVAEGAVDMGMAERWFARLLDPQCPQVERDACARWRAQSAEHDAAWREVEQLWQLGEEAVRGDPALLAMAGQALHSGRTRRRRWMTGLATAAVLALVAVPLFRYWHAQRVPAGVVYATARGEQRNVTLTDGARIVLDTDSRIVVRYGARQRRVDLLRGRAEFSVHDNPERPFVVHVDGGTVTDIGTRFQVGLDDDRVRVVLLQGQVAVATDVDGMERHATLQAAQQLSFDRSGVIGPITPVDLAMARGWTSGKLVVHDWKLPELLKAMNRYSRTQIGIADPSLRELRISGVFRAGDQKTLLLALQQGWSLHARQTAPDRIVLTRD